MLMPWGPRAVPTGGAGVALPADRFNLRTVRIFFATGGEFLSWSLSLLELFDLQEVELHGRLAAEDAHEDLHLVALGIDVVDRPDELGKGTVGDADTLALGEGDPVLGCLDAHVAEDLLDLRLVERDRLAADAGDIGAADEARHAGRVANDVPAIGVEDHLD